MSDCSEGLLESCVVVLTALRWESLALMRAFSIVRSSSARWHCASSWLDDSEALARRGEEERDDKEGGREGRGMDIGVLMLSLLGGEDDGLMLSEEPRRERRLLPLSRSSTFSLGMLIQEIFSGMLHCRVGGAKRCGTNLGGGGRGGGHRDTLYVALSFCLQLVWLLLSCSSVFVPRLFRSLLSDWLQTLWSELGSWRLLLQECWVSLLLGSWMLIIISSLRLCFAVPEGLAVVLWSPSDWWTLMKRGLMKHSAPLDWQHSSSDGVRVRSRGRSEETGIWAGGGGLLGAAVSDNESEPLLVWHNWASQKPVWESGRMLV